MLRSTGAVFCLWLAASTLTGCGQSTPTKSGTVAGGGAGKAAVVSNKVEKGFCSDTCPKACDQDDDCMTATGELCCDFGSDGKACVPARECPRLCAEDARCETERGEACIRVSLENKSTVCAPAAAALPFCKGDTDCKGVNEVCCQDFNEPICVPQRACPNTCRSVDDCNPMHQICCTTISKLDPTVKSGGLCLESDAVQCPTRCTQSSECNTQRGELCCDGYCSDSCERSCEQSSDCVGQICCRTRAARSTLWSGGNPQSIPISSGGCVPGTASTPGSFDDPCPQEDSRVCPTAMGYAAIAICGPDGQWQQECSCYPPGKFVPPPSSGGAGGASGGSAGSRATASCGQLATDDCNTCCEQSEPSGAKEFLGYIIDCVCDSGACAAVCQAKSFCANPDLATPVSSACNTCLSDSCTDELVKRCQSSAPCADYVACAGGC